MKKPVFRRDLHKKLYHGMAAVPPGWYSSLDEAITDILKQDAETYITTIQCQHCMKLSGGEICRHCPIDWGVPITNSETHLCCQPGSPLLRLNDVLSTVGMEQIVAMKYKELCNVIADLPLSKDAKFFDVVE